MKNRFIINTILIVLALFSIDRLFVFFAYNILFDESMFRMLIFAIQLGLVIGLLMLFTKKLYKFIISFIIIFYAIYAIAQITFKSFMGNFMSIKASFDGAGRVTNEIMGFIESIDPLSLIILIVPIIVTILISTNRIFEEKEIKLANDTTFKGALIIFIVIFNVVTTMIITNKDKDEVNSVYALYNNPIPIELGLKKLGSNTFLIRDILTVNAEKSLSLHDEDIENTTSPTPDIVDVYKRDIDDSLWVDLMNQETDETVKQIDNYLYNRENYDHNEYTGMFEGKNLVYVMIEAFDYMAIDKNMTPTLYMMQNSGIVLENYYTPKYSCTTAETEFIAMHSLVPSLSVCTPNTYIDNMYSQSLYNLFRNDGYTTSGYHNWTDEFYERSYFHLNYGADKFLGIEDLNWSPYVNGWQSDVELMEKSIPHYVEDEPFMSFVITSALHFPYDEYSYYGEANLEKVNEYFPNDHQYIKRYKSKAIEVDNALKALLDGLENEGVLDDTVIVVYADHHPLNTDLNLIADHTTQLDRTKGLNIDRTPAFIYSTDIKEPIIVKDIMSTFDLAPTIANLFGLKFDPRFYLGRDVFSEQDPLVVFANSDWVNDKGIYYANSNEFEPYNINDNLTEKEIISINNKVGNYISISEMIYETDYFDKRDFKVKYD